MTLQAYLTDAAGHALQMIPPMLLYFLCVPDEMYRGDKRTVRRRYFTLALVLILSGSAVKLLVLQNHAGVSPHIVSVALLFVEFVLLSVLTGRFVAVPAGPGNITILLVLFWGTMQYTVSRFVLIFLGQSGTYDGRTILVFAVFTAVLFPVAMRLFVPYAKEYMLIREAVRSPAQIMVFGMAAVSIVQLFLASAEENERDFFILSLMSVCVTATHWILIRYVVGEEQRTRTELHLLASQIRPHFILNTLNAIINLADEDTDATKRAMYDFSGYLRMNFEALKKVTPVMFEEELKHVRFYLSIEKLRFRDELDIMIDTPVTDFELPALTVQPMVENAVRHGLRGKEGPGSLVLNTRETDDAYEVVIRDDGIGMDLSRDGANLSQENGSHYGIRNVRERLRRMVGGTLHMESAPGSGTTVTIRIPKRDKR